MTRLVTLALVAGLVACADGDATPSAAPVEPVASTPAVGDGIIGGMDPEMRDAVVAQASEETGVDAGEIRVLSAEAVTWSDGAIGCPQEGMSYTQALVPGFRVVLDVAGEEMHYHAGGDGIFFACDDPQEPLGDGTVDR